jgi:hypothetical protein
MKRLFGLLGLACILPPALGATLPAQQTPLPAKHAVRIPIRHADPWFVKGLVEGQPLVMPELSTIFGLFGAPPQSAGQVNGLFAGGHFLVNPTDNSLWWYPD